ncbi:ABC transporter permease [Dickeya zeae]|uniref:ABC transporter permease n=1 Tax=Dickeya zeae TaxID=204042 RepID=A0AAE7CYH0_9GAMM|nr:ABC transporter permease [Dickeya zeae]QIZ50931.1 ABC transporter permease [Dickeya zeae]QYM90723.1 ABC transporter permease [Dickeya zeae]
MRWTFLFPVNRQSARRRVALNSINVCFFMLTLLTLVALFAPWLAPFDPYTHNVIQRLQPPGPEHWLGTDGFGRDLLSRVIYGTRPVLIMVALILIITIPVGLLVGVGAGYLGGWIDRVLMRLTDIMLALPGLVIALSLVAVLGPGLLHGALALALSAWPQFARQARAETMALRNSEFLVAARMQGINGWRLMYGHVLPLCLPGALARAAMTPGNMILAAAGLGFLGLGAPPPMAEWGAMVAEGSNVMLEQWWVATMPGLAIFLTSLTFNLLGNALRDRLDPRYGKH